MSEERAVYSTVDQGVVLTNGEPVEEWLIMVGTNDGRRSGFRRVAGEWRFEGEPEHFVWGLRDCEKVTQRVHEQQIKEVKAAGGRHLAREAALEAVCEAAVRTRQYLRGEVLGERDLAAHDAYHPLAEAIDALAELDALPALEHANAAERLSALEAVSRAAQRLDARFPSAGEMLHSAIYGDLRAALVALRAKGGEELSRNSRFNGWAFPFGFLLGMALVLLLLLFLKGGGG